MIVRSANERDLQRMVGIWMATDGDSAGQELPVPVVLRHALRTGATRVAEVDGIVTGFATSLLRDNVTFLAQMFVDPDRQSAGVGQALLRAVMPDDGSVRATVSSPDPRAVALYVRHGMTPAWPVFDLKATSASLSGLPVSLAEVLPCAGGIDDLVEMDAKVGGRYRAVDHQHWIEDRGGIPFKLERRGKLVGFGYVQVGSNGADAAFRSGSVRIGPLGVTDASAAYDCVLAAVRFACQHGERPEILMPGPHPALGALLEAGFRIEDIETFLTSASPPFVDGSVYVPSGGALF